MNTRVRESLDTGKSLKKFDRVYRHVQPWRRALSITAITQSSKCAIKNMKMMTIGDTSLQTRLQLRS